MPANLPPTYHDAEARFRAAKTTEDKIAALEEMLRIMPKHKGTDRLQADLKARIAKLRRQPRTKGARHSFSRTVPREGAGQVALVGLPNAGKSSLVDLLTHASPEVAEYPFTTREPVPGMMPFEDIAFQLVDLPPLSGEYVEPWVFDVIRGADMLWVVLDGESPLVGEDEARALLDAKKIIAYPAGAAAPEDRPTGSTCKPALLVATRLDMPGCVENIEALAELLDSDWPLIGVSNVDGRGLEDLKRRTFESAGIIRVYTKQPGKPADREQPFTLPRGSTVGDLASTIHKEIVETFRFARIWGAGAFDGQTVQRDHVLHEGNVVELHT